MNSPLPIAETKATEPACMASVTASHSIFSTPPTSFCARPRFLYSSFFCWFAVCGGRFLALFLEHEATLSPTEIGVALASQQLISLIFSAIGASLADTQEAQSPGKGRAHVLGLGVVLGSSCFLSHSLIPTETPSSFPSYCTALHIFLQALFALCTCFIGPVLDGMTIHFLKEKNSRSESSTSTTKTADYGKERLFGAISWAVSNLLLSIALDRVGYEIMYPLSIVSAGGVLLSIWIYVAHQEKSLHTYQVCDTIIQNENISSDRTVFESTNVCNVDLSTVFDTAAQAQNEEKSEVSTNTKPTGCTPTKCTVSGKGERTTETSCTAWRSLIRGIVDSRCSIAFMICVFCLAVGQVLVDSLVFLLFEFLGSSFTVMGWTVVLTVIFEIPIFHIAPTLLQRFGSSALLLTATVCYVTRVAVYSIIPQGHILFVLLVEPLHGITYACSQTASVDFMAQVEQQQQQQRIQQRQHFGGHEALAQGFLQTVKGAGSMAGLLVGGWADGTLGPRMMYRMSGAVVAFGAIIFTSSFLDFPWICSWRRRGHAIVSGSEVIMCTTTEEEEEDDDDDCLDEDIQGRRHVYELPEISHS